MRIKLTMESEDGEYWCSSTNPDADEHDAVINARDFSQRHVEAMVAVCLAKMRSR